MSDLVQFFVCLTFAIVFAVFITTLVVAKHEPLEKKYHLKDGRTVHCLIDRRLFSESLSCDWANARKEDR